MGDILVCYCKFCPPWEVSKWPEFLTQICLVNILYIKKNYENEYADRVFLGNIGNDEWWKWEFSGR